ncbi:hypothetical protein JL722_14097 [Aureococcus anophagefferens]|nr:hypothetical protein JL722_14097 [Aureococcus anophagefferens]
MAEPLVEEMPRAPKPLWGSSCPPPEPPQAPAEAPATSALEANTKSKGSNAYYYAHASKDWSVPDNAKIISGAGITTGCGPQRLDPEHGEAAEASSPAAGDAALRAEIDRLKSRVSAMAQRRATETPLTKYSFSDSKDNVKVYVERRSFTLVIAKPSVDTAVDSVERYKLDISNLRYVVREVHLQARRGEGPRRRHAWKADVLNEWTSLSLKGIL